VDENEKEKRPRKTMTTAFSPGVTLFKTFFQGNYFSWLGTPGLNWDIKVYS
jgi:hypothetical protein